MLITDVEATILCQPDVDDSKADGSQDALAIRIHTDEGITGIGEVDSLPPVIKAIVEAPPSHEIASGLKALLVGENPLETDRLWEKMYRGSIYYGRRGPAIHAISGIDIALWDIKGKVLGQPIYLLLGGPRRITVRAYASTLMPDNPRETTETVVALVARGFTAIKLGWGPLGSDPDLDVALVRAAREAAGDEIELMFDIDHGWPDADHAIQMVDRLRQYRPYWIEEPLVPDDLPGYAKLSDAISTRIAAGEQNATRWDFQQLIAEGHIDVVQPDVTRAGGISECVRIAHIADLNGVVMVPHSWSTGIIKAASLHVLAAMRQATFFEYCVQDTTLNQHLVTERFPLSDGLVSVPDGPGLGIEIDTDVVRSFTV